MKKNQGIQLWVKVGLSFYVFLSATSTYAIDLTVAVDLAEKKDQTLASAFLNKDAAFENIAIARSKLLPQVNAQGNYAKLKENNTQIGAQGPIYSHYGVTSKNTSLNLRQGLFRPRDWVGYSLGELQAEYGMQKLVSAQSDLWNRVVSAWVDVLAAEANRVAQVEAVKSTKHAADQARKRFVAGDGTRDVQIEASAQYSLAQAQLYEAEQVAFSKQQFFELLTGEKVSTKQYRLPKFNRVKFFLKDFSALLDQVLDKNSDLLSSKITEAMNEKKMLQAKYDHLPTVDLVSSVSRSQSDTINTVNQKYGISQIGVQISVPLYAGGGIDAAERQLAYIYAASKSDREALEVRIRGQLANDWSTEKSTYERAQAAESLVRGAVEQLRSAEMGLKSGVRTWADIANYDMLLARRQSDYISYAATLIKTQSKILATLPVTEPSWVEWVKFVSESAKL